MIFSLYGAGSQRAVLVGRGKAEGVPSHWNSMIFAVAGEIGKLPE
jgi:hypothetical protein